MIYKQYTFWVLIAGVLAYVVKYFAPDFPFDADTILAFVVFILGLLGVQVEGKLRKAGLL